MPFLKYEKSISVPYVEHSCHHCERNVGRVEGKGNVFLYLTKPMNRVAGKRDVPNHGGHQRGRVRPSDVRKNGSNLESLYLGKKKGKEVPTSTLFTVYTTTPTGSLIALFQPSKGRPRIGRPFSRTLYLNRQLLYSRETSRPNSLDLTQSTTTKTRLRAVNELVTFN
jgi:hypothetical protein